MNDVRPSDGLLSARQTIALLDRIRERGGQKEEQLARDLAATEGAAVSRTSSSLATLGSFGIIQAEGGSISLTDGWSQQQDWEEGLRPLLARLVADRIRDARAEYCLGSQPGTGHLWLDSMTLPNPGQGLLLWLVGFGVLHRPPGSRHWLVDERYAELFVNLVRAANESCTRTGVSLNQLDARLAAQSEQGNQAEEWVLAHEVSRLSEHPFCDQIRRVSLADVSAGYDIVSFSSCDALNHDLFIEVKSYTGPKRFFWTRNEIRRAEELGEKYALYLVDMKNKDQPGYAPQVVIGPYAALFLAEGGAWRIEPAVFEVVADDNADFLGAPSAFVSF